jgi:hypothetical protein
LLLLVFSKSLRGLSELQATALQVSLSTGKVHAWLLDVRNACRMHDQLDQAYCTFHICNPIPFTYEPVEAFRIIQFQTVATESPLLPIYAASSRVKTQSVLTKTLLTVSDKPVAETICPG